MNTDNLNIQQYLDISKQQDELIRGHQSEMQQALEDKQRLRTIIIQQLSTIDEQDATIAQMSEALTQKDKQIAQLLQRIADLEKPTTLNNIAGDYYQQMNINTQNNFSAPIPTAALPQYRKRKSKSKSKLSTSDLPQLPLWQTS